MNSRSLPGGRATAPVRLDPDLHPSAGIAARHRSDHGGAVLRFMDQLAGAATDLLSLAVPIDCVCCGAEDRALCIPCDRHIRRLTAVPFRAESGAPALMDVDGAALLPVVAAGVYREELAQALLSFKRHGQHQLKRSLGRGLGGAVRAACEGSGEICLVPVPTSTKAYLSRGFSPVHLLLGGASQQLGGLDVVDVLAKAGGSVLQLPGGQKGLGRGARASRVRGSMRVNRRGQARVAGRRCVIIDDVLTTGSTLAEAARALHAAGARVAGAVVLAATRPPDTGATAPHFRRAAEATVT